MCGISAKHPDYLVLVNEDNKLPKGKESVTKIAYEPWHYRYIDSPQIAQKITEKGLCLEEHLQNA